MNKDILHKLRMLIFGAITFQVCVPSMASNKNNCFLEIKNIEYMYILPFDFSSDIEIDNNKIKIIGKKIIPEKRIINEIFLRVETSKKKVNISSRDYRVLIGVVNKSGQKVEIGFNKFCNWIYCKKFVFEVDENTADQIHKEFLKFIK